ncbi:M55 family metallopeptidase [Polyangium jinanense]|uniref:M55 family metallopeptidase n=1 Tax=Polyangium jinanense TaxID=2829994 RepID=A0A9X3XEU8_9BACT|nr:M55 family metallopeptidase [Polyangium jinanense]MDC3958053.1 M55 family metallopeptidase [Polyangium jinanense]MDC3989319.1 M55 family metallopeptidase [Polyangium jinanense]
MQVYISVDMEGVAGVVHVDQTRRTGADYERARRWMTYEANAAVTGAFEGGATSVLVNDSHGDMRNLLLDELDPRAEIVTGSLKPLSMVQGIAPGFGCALFVGYHAGAGSRAGILDHTFFGRVVARCRVGGRDFNETAINAAVCGALGIPVALVTGDQTVCAQAREILGEVETVQVKEAITRYAARSLSPVAARERVREGAARAVRRAREGAFSPFRPALPLDLEIDFVNSACADAAELVPFTERRSGTACGYRAPDAATVVQVIEAWTILAASTMV